ncbi:hypothetical protein HDU93_002527 [Gonapodya sp. JEL0774]|nr:hypothetical protein HDU93_002527 [Gonapodya sp. JEL0774]
MLKRVDLKDHIASQSQVKGSVQRSIRQKVIDTYPALSPFIDELLPKKAPMILVKCHEHVNLVAVDGEILFFNHYDGPYLPHLKLLHQYPDILPALRADKGAIKFILSGANIMCPGLTSKGATMPLENLQKGTPVAIFAEGKEHALAVGILEMSTDEMLFEPIIFALPDLISNRPKQSSLVNQKRKVQMTISSLLFIPKGAAAPVPSRYKLTDEEFERINQAIEGTEDGEGGGGDTEAVVEGEQDTEMKTEDDAKASPAEPDLSEFNLEKYDDEESAATGEGEDPETAGNSRLFSNISSLKYYKDDSEDPFLTKVDNDNKDDEDEEPDEKLDMRILPSDNLLLAARTKDEVSQVEVYVYEPAHDNLYVHHDFLLPSFPLCLEWLDFPVGEVPSSASRAQGKPSQSGGRNFVAVGTFDPTIEIWNLDLVDAVYPELLLGDDKGGLEASSTTRPTGKKKKKGKKAIIANPHTHIAAVLALSSNRSHRNLLISASADTTVKLWDLNSPSRAASNYTHHKDKVACVEWNWSEASVAVSSGYDKKAHLFDTRSPGATSPISLPSDPEALLFDPFTPTTLYITTDSGLLIAYDTRHTAKPMWTLHAHDGPASTIAVSSSIRGCLVTGGDGGVKVWDVTTGGVKSVVSKEVGVGKVFSTSFIPDPTTDTPLAIAVGGSTGKLVVWNVSENDAVQTAFGNRLSGIAVRTSKPEITTVEEEDEPESDDDEDDEGEEDGAEGSQAESGDDDEMDED